LAKVKDLTGEGVRYDTNTDLHHHLFCLGCNSLVDLGGEVEEPQIALDEAAGYRIVRHQVTFYGYCPDCQDD
jgi:Fe2+ or Zn2+ uptake regulation protein